MKKVLLVKSKNLMKQKQACNSKSPPLAEGVIVPGQPRDTTYKERKTNQAVYGELFKLLMYLPDKELQQRVIDAINNRSSYLCKSCKLNVNINDQRIEKVNAATQTSLTDLEAKHEAFDHLPTKDSVLKDQESQQPNNSVIEYSNTSKTCDEKTPKPASTGRKRGRKRNTCVPKVVKQSTAQLAQQEREDKQLTPIIKKRKTVPQSELPTTSQSPLKRRDSVESLGFTLSDIDMSDPTFCVENYINDNINLNIYNIMAKECLKANQMSVDGLLPIHESILYGDICGLQRQIYVWSKLKVDGRINFNDLLSADGEDCLQLAITNDCETEIVQIVLEKCGVLPNHIYEESNTIIHIAVINNIQLSSLRELLHKIDLNLLLERNDDGYTALHMAVRNNQYKIAETICNVIDERSLGKSIYNRTPVDPNQNSKNNIDLAEQKCFSKFYENACDELKKKHTGVILKQKFLNMIDARAGNVALFFAIEGEMEHFCYFLLAHLCNPEEKNLTGYSPKSYHYEFVRNLRINLKVARVMDKVTELLSS